MGRKVLIAAISVVAITGCGSSQTTTVIERTTTTVTTTSTAIVAAASTAAQSSPPVASSGSGPCDGHPCIGDWQREAAAGGSVVQCSDGAYSHAGGLSGACSYHGGESSAQSTAPAAGASGDPGSGGPGYAVEAQPVQCGAGVSGSSGMSCTFAENAFYEYWQAVGGGATAPASINVWSPEGHQSYPLSCNAGDGVVDCVGTNGSGAGLDARFSQDAVTAYTSDNAAAYAATGKLGPGH